MPAVGQIASFILDYGMTMQEAVEAPRIDASGGGTIVADERLEGPVTEALKARWPLATIRRMPFAFACPCWCHARG